MDNILKKVTTQPLACPAATSQKGYGFLAISILSNQVNTYERSVEISFV
jgi:hypothetical protein